jgi:transcriptional regulator with XRE-family HTH domain
VNSEKAARDDRVRLARKLRELRRAAGLGGIEAGRRSGISQSKISKIETGLLRASPDDVRKLCEVYKVPPADQQDLIQLAELLRAGAIEPRRVTLSRGANQMQQRIHRLEAAASLLRSFQPCMVIGLLQTEAYARLVFGATTTGDSLDRAVAARMARQSEFRDGGHGQAVLIMTEGALRWQAGSPQVMLEQISAIMTATSSPSTRVGIIPYSTSVGIFPRHGFHLYDSDAVIIGTETGTATIVDSDDVADYEKLFGRLESLAAFDDSARRVLARIAGDYRAL